MLYQSKDGEVKAECTRRCRAKGSPDVFYLEICWYCGLDHSLSPSRVLRVPIRARRAPLQNRGAGEIDYLFMRCQLSRS